MRRSIIIVACLSGLLSGCNQLPLKLSEDNSESRELVALIAYANKFVALQPEEQRKELNVASQSFQKDRSPQARVRLAMVLSLPGTAFTDEARAMSLLEPLANATGEDAAKPAVLRQFAGLLYADVGERVREQRKSAQWKEQATQLKDQLDALRAIERSIIERGKPK
jgi:hypothetical protein